MDKFCIGDEQVDRQEEQIAHGRNGITPAVVHKTARNGSNPSYYEFATQTFIGLLNQRSVKFDRPEPNSGEPQSAMLGFFNQ